MVSWSSSWCELSIVQNDEEVSIFFRGEKSARFIYLHLSRKDWLVTCRPGLLCRLDWTIRFFYWLENRFYFGILQNQSLSRIKRVYKVKNWRRSSTSTIFTFFSTSLKGFITICDSINLNLLALVWLAAGWLVLVSESAFVGGHLIPLCHRLCNVMTIHKLWWWSKKKKKCLLPVLLLPVSYIHSFLPITGKQSFLLYNTTYVSVSLHHLRIVIIF